MSVTKNPKNQTSDEIQSENELRESSITEFLKKSDNEIRKATACKLDTAIGTPATPPKGHELYVHKHWLIRPTDKVDLDRINTRLSHISMAFGVPTNLPETRVQQLKAEQKQLEAKLDKLKDGVYKRGSDYLRATVSKAAEWASVPAEMLAAVLQNENSQNATDWQRFLQGRERALQSLIRSGSTGFGNVKPGTLSDVTSMFKKYYKRTVLRPGVKNQGQNKFVETDIYHAAAVLRDGLNKAWSAGDRSLNSNMSKRYKYYPYFGGTVTADVAIRAMGHYNGMGNAALGYGKTAMARIKKQRLYFLP